MERLADKALATIKPVPTFELHGTVVKVLGLLVEIAGFGKELSIGSVVHLRPKPDKDIPCEVIGFRENRALLMPFGTLEGVGLGCIAVIQRSEAVVFPDDRWLGRVINALGEPIDGKGPLLEGAHPIPLKNKAPPPHARQRVGGKLDLGVRAVNTFLSTVHGQRMGIFSGSGVGKSVTLSMMARYTEADIAVIGLVGERGREVQEFLEDDLGEDGLARSVVIVATGDEPALMRRQAAYMTLAVAEYFRMQGKEVLCLIDSVTRFAMAQREIGLSAGEPPTSKGYPPTTFGELARLLERAGPGVVGEGNITGIFTVLVEGDDTNEPISDAVRGILDGHIVMERAIAARGRYPAINVLKSVSRAMPKCLTEEQRIITTKAKQLISRYEDMAELIRLGAYRKGTDREVDEAIARYPALEDFLRQGKEESNTIEESFAKLAQILGLPYVGENPPEPLPPKAYPVPPRKKI
jgi:flagellum-specific ATP synthase